jgi:hypothetical protein
VEPHGGHGRQGADKNCNYPLIIHQLPGLQPCEIYGQRSVFYRHIQSLRVLSEEIPSRWTRLCSTTSNLRAGFSIAEKKRPAKDGMGSSAEDPPQLDPCAYCQTVGSEPFVKCISYTAPVVAEPLTHGWISAHNPKMCTKTLHLKRPTETRA